MSEPNKVPELFRLQHFSPVFVASHRDGKCVLKPVSKHDEGNEDRRYRDRSLLDGALQIC